MKLKVNPMVLAAALGLLGPAALADDEDEVTMPLAGQWVRAPSARPAHAGLLEPTIELIPVEGRLLLGEGDGARESWVSEVGHRWSQELDLGAARVTRSFARDGESLTVETTVIEGGVIETFTDAYGRLA